MSSTANSGGNEAEVFCYDEHDGSGSRLNNKYYYSLAGQLIGVLNNNGTNFLFTDALGSVVSTISNTANSASVQGNQVFGPYGANFYSKGKMNTTKGYTGQYADALTQLDYYGARYYDPLVGVFLSADVVQGNPDGMNPYNYVGDSPETFNDPTGNYYSTPTGAPGPVAPPEPPVETSNPLTWPEYTPGGSQDAPPPQDIIPWFFLPIQIVIATVAAASLVLATPSDLASGTVLIPYGTPFRSKSPDEVNGPPSPFTLLLPPQTQPGSGGGQIPPGGAPPVAPAGEPCSFTPATPVTTNHGKEPIGKVQVGEKVLAYNPKTHKMELEPVLHVWINHDNDLIDLTLTTILVIRHGRTAMRTSETVHTNRKHPFLTEEKGFLPVGQIKIGMHVLRSDGTYGIVTGWKVVPGTKVMYNLEVALDHTFTVGTGQWVVHNCGVGDSPNLGRGTVFSHFTDASGVRGITGVDPASLELGQTVSVNELHFGQGANSFMATESGDIFVTELGADATARQLAQIGVFGEKQAFVIQFSQEAAVMNDAIPTATNAARSIFTIPGDSVLQDFGFLVTRLR